MNRNEDQYEEKLVWIIEDDVFASAMMQSLITRDWRTAVEKITYGKDDSLAYLDDPKAETIDCVILDIDTYNNDDWPYELGAAIRKRLPNVVIIATCTGITTSQLLDAIQLDLDGVMLKQDIKFAIAGAVCKSSRKQWLTTKTIFEKLPSLKIELPVKQTHVAEYAFDKTKLSERENFIFHLTALFSHSRKDVADELNLKYRRARKVVSRIYGLLEIDENKLNWDKLGIKLHDKSLAQQLKERNPDNETISFYLLTTVKVSKQDL